jgi:hypothetical protein
MQVQRNVAHDVFQSRVTFTKFAAQLLAGLEEVTDAVIA